MKINDFVKIKTGKQIVYGTVIYTNKYYFTLKTEHYNESFLHVDISNGRTILDNSCNKLVSGHK